MRKYLLPILLISLYGCEPLAWDVEYRVSGSGGSFDVTISNEDDGTSQFDNVSSGWKHSFSTTDSDHFLYVSAQNQNSTGSVTAKIYVDGREKKKSTSNGAYVIASCSMSVDD